ncbi:MAG TPA: hypothetical protein VKJ47_11910 [Candidatus Binatia bacterium]|nr:hypothetical protein [Candidatus Binatia bacterium]
MAKADHGLRIANEPGCPAVQPGQGKRIFGSMLLLLGGGFILETPYQWSGIGIIVVAIVLVALGWKEHWQRRERGEGSS